MHAIALASLRAFIPVVQSLKYVLPLYRSMASSKVIDFNTKHLKRGDPIPLYNGKLRIYNMRYCPYAQRTILVLNAKGLDYEVVNIDLMDKPEWLTSKSCFGKVPAIEVENGVCIAESLITSEYLDEVYPQRRLLPKDPIKKALHKVLIEASAPIQGLLIRIIKAPDTLTDEHFAAYYKYLSLVQDELKKNGTKFLGGNEPGFVDYMIWPWFERVVLIEDSYKEVAIDGSKYTLLLEYLNNMLQDPAVSQYLIPKDILVKFFDGYKPGNTVKYDLLE